MNATEPAIDKNRIEESVSETDQPDSTQSDPSQQKLEEPAAERSISLIDADLDQEIVGVFVEEADDIVSSIEESVLAWRSNPKQVELADRLKRDLHTLKGGARMAGFNALGERAHAIESLIDATKNHNKKFFKAMIATPRRASECLRYCSSNRSWR